MCSERFLECGDLHCGFARIRCGGCGQDLLPAFFLKDALLLPELPSEARPRLRRVVKLPMR
jgi:hypothetical protein